MPGIWSKIFKNFPRPWKIKKRKGGGFWIEAKNGRTLLYVYPERENHPEWRKPSEDEGRDIVRTIAKLSRRKHRPGRRVWVPVAQRRRWRSRRTLFIRRPPI